MVVVVVVVVVVVMVVDPKPCGCSSDICSWATRLLQSEATDGQQQHVCGSQLESAAPVPVYVPIARLWQSIRDRGPRASMDLSLLLWLLLWN